MKYQIHCKKCGSGYDFEGVSTCGCFGVVKAKEHKFSSPNRKGASSSWIHVNAVSSSSGKCFGRTGFFAVSKDEMEKLFKDIEKMTIGTDTAFFQSFDKLICNSSCIERVLDQNLIESLIECLKSTLPIGQYVNYRQSFVKQPWKLRASNLNIEDNFRECFVDHAVESACDNKLSLMYDAMVNRLFACACMETANNSLFELNTLHIDVAGRHYELPVNVCPDAVWVHEGVKYCIEVKTRTKSCKGAFEKSLNEWLRQIACSQLNEDRDRVYLLVVLAGIEEGERKECNIFRVLPHNLSVCMEEWSRWFEARVRQFPESLADLQRYGRGEMTFNDIADKYFPPPPPAPKISKASSAALRNALQVKKPMTASATSNRGFGALEDSEDDEVAETPAAVADEPKICATSSAALFSLLQGKKSPTTAEAVSEEGEELGDCTDNSTPASTGK